MLESFHPLSGQRYRKVLVRLKNLVSNGFHPLSGQRYWKAVNMYIKEEGCLRVSIPFRGKGIGKGGSVGNVEGSSAKFPSPFGAKVSERKGMG